MERESQEITYIVNIQAAYNKAIFEFSSIEDASKFMDMAALNNIEGEDDVVISMKVKREGEEESDK